jgi:hypothetical protein
MELFFENKRLTKDFGFQSLKGNFQGRCFSTRVTDSSLGPFFFECDKQLSCGNAVTFLYVHARHNARLSCLNDLRTLSRNDLSRCTGDLIDLGETRPRQQDGDTSNHAEESNPCPKGATHGCSQCVRGYSNQFIHATAFWDA